VENTLQITADSSRAVLADNCAESKHLNEATKLQLCEWFGEDIGCVIIRRYVYDFDLLVLNGFADEVISNVNMFGMCMKLVILG